MSIGAGFAYHAARDDELLGVFESRHAPGDHSRAHQTCVRDWRVLGLADRTKAPLHIVHINSAGGAATRGMLQKIADARARGMDVTTEAYPYAAGMTEIQSANLDEYEKATEQRLALLEWPRTGERLTRESFQKYRQTGGPVVLHTNTEDIVAVAVNSPLPMSRAIPTGRAARVTRAPRELFKVSAGTSARRARSMMDAIRR